MACLGGVRLERAVEPAAFTGFAKQREQSVRHRTQQQHLTIRGAVVPTDECQMLVESLITESPIRECRYPDAGRQPEDARRLRRQPPRPTLSPQYVHQFVDQLIGEDFHAKRVLSLSNGVVGAIHAAALAVHMIGEGLALAEGLDPKHAIKQVDRLLSNPAISVDVFFGRWVPYVVAVRKALRVALDWTEFDRDGQTTIALYLLTNHGRATPLSPLIAPTWAP